MLIEGFTVQGPGGSAKKIIVRAIGPSLIPFGVTDAVANPTLEIHDSNNATIATNNDWRVTQVGGIITADQSGEIAGSGLAPGNDLESAIIANLSPGSYTAIVRGFGNTTGTGVVDAYDFERWFLGSEPGQRGHAGPYSTGRSFDDLRVHHPERSRESRGSSHRPVPHGIWG